MQRTEFFGCRELLGIERGRSCVLKGLGSQNDLNRPL
jgi:hypothetical protein